MKQVLLSLLMAFSLIETAMAVPAYPYPRKFTQGDGTTLTIRVSGDEFFHYTSTIDGYLLAFNKTTASYEYATIAGDTLKLSGITAHDDGSRSTSELAFIGKQNTDSINIYKSAGKQKVKAKRARSARASAEETYGPSYVSPKMRITNVPTTGKQKALAVLVDFPDKAFSEYVGDAKCFYTRLLNEPNYTNEYGATGSAYDFYHTTSCGLYEPQFDVVGPVTVSKSYTYYGGKDGMENVPDMIAEVAKLIKDSVNLSDYDGDGDSVLDFIYVFYAGYGQSDSEYTDVIWPHSWELTSGGIDLTIDGIQVNLYACSQELLGYAESHEDLVGKPTSIGTFVHEFGHVLGIPDLYNTDNNTDTKTPANYDTMDSGSYNNDQCTPPLFSAYERYALGWLEPTLLTANTDTTWTLPALTDENTAYLVKTTSDSNYFIMENRQLKGWDAYLPQHGMLVWKIQENADTWYSNTVNNASSASKKGVYFVAAKTIMPTPYPNPYIPFPGKDYVTNKTIWDGSNNIVFSFKDVKETSDGTISFKISNAGQLPTTGIGKAVMADGTDENSYFNLQGYKVNSPSKGVYIVKQGEETKKVYIK